MGHLAKLTNAVDKMAVAIGAGNCACCCFHICLCFTLILCADVSEGNVETLRRGSSYDPTSQSVTPLPPVVDRSLLVRQREEAEVNRYGRYLRAHAQHFNSDCDVCWNRRRLYIQQRGEVVFDCLSTPEAIKSAYCLFRLLESNLTSFLSHLKENGGVVQSIVDSETPPHLHHDVNVGDEDV